MSLKVRFCLVFWFFLLGVPGAAPAHTAAGINHADTPVKSHRTTHANFNHVGHRALVTISPFSGSGKKLGGQVEAANSESEEDRCITGKKHGKAVKEFTAFFYDPAPRYPVISASFSYYPRQRYGPTDRCLLFGVLRI